jgi:hypothetical protein
VVLNIYAKAYQNLLSIVFDVAIFELDASQFLAYNFGGFRHGFKRFFWNRTIFHGNNGMAYPGIDHITMSHLALSQINATSTLRLFTFFDSHFTCDGLFSGVGINYSFNKCDYRIDGKRGTVASA